jgi:SAM-dependent methyltransferase
MAFEEVAEAYDRARPTYPPELFDDLAELAELPTGARVLEVGCGTGQATLPLAERGLVVTCVELGERLAELARRKLSRFPAVDVVNAMFETWEPAEAGFDAVVAFTAWHWLDPDVRYRKAAGLLAPGGTLSVVATKHVLPADGDRFFVDVQQDYVDLQATREWGDGPPPPPEHVRDLAEEFESSALFGAVAVRRYLWDVEYTADEYLTVLDTYSGHRALDPALRSELYGRIRRRIDAPVRKTYLATLNVARRR